MADSALWLFVYGTLKRGHSNHARYCAGYDACVPASVRGALYSLPAGYPMLAVPPETILAIGTVSPDADLQMQVERAATSSSGTEPPNLEGADGLRVVQGELLSFADPARLILMDQLEGFVPGRESLYDRVLIRTLDPHGQVVWTYVASGGRLPAGAKAIDAWP